MRIHLLISICWRVKNFLWRTVDAWGRFASNSRSRSLINISHIQYYIFFSCHEAQQLEKAYMAKKFCVCLTSTTRIACKSPPPPFSSTTPITIYGQVQLDWAHMSTSSFCSARCLVPEECYSRTWSPEIEEKFTEHASWHHLWSVYKAFRRRSHCGWCAGYGWMEKESWDVER